jgi:riboflavin kinase / FMN adenylyltransferase
MKVFFSFEEAGKSLKASSPIITWGVFDGVHRGHQILINNVIIWAKKIQTPSLIITFQGHPERVLNMRNDPLFITSLSHRLMLMEQLGIDNCLVLRFDKRLSRLPAKDFIAKVINIIKPTGIVVTNNILFGKERRGNVHLLRSILIKHNIGLKIIKPLRYHKKIISSSLIRKKIVGGSLYDAHKMIGRPVAILGTVVRGEGRGRNLGFPTANLDPHHEILPPHGVYLAKAQYFKGSQIIHRTFKALVNIGVKPTFHQKPTSKQKETIEVYLLSYNQKKYHSLYRKNILVEIISRLRDEKKFPNPDLLINQIKADVKQLKTAFN